MDNRQPVTWVLLGARAGDNAQALEVARRIGGQTVAHQLEFNPLSFMPNFLLGAGFRTVQPKARMMLRPPWPDIVIATGRRAAPISLAVKQASGGSCLAIHVGRPRMALKRFDLVLTTAQYGLPPDDNVVELDFPFARAKDVAAPTLEAFRTLWSHLPRPWIVGVIGAGKFPVRFGSAEVKGFAEGVEGLAKRLGGSAILMDSPRSAPGAIAEVARHLSVPHWLWARGEGDNPYQAAIHLADCFAVTSDSVSMVSEMVQAGRPTYVFKLPVASCVPGWKARSGIAATLARQGLLSPPRDVEAFLAQLLQKGWIGDLGGSSPPRVTFHATDEHATAIARILSLWRGRATD
jgi:mitochondrial fission protein ELM1